MKILILILIIIYLVFCVKASNRFARYLERKRIEREIETEYYREQFYRDVENEWRRKNGID